MSDHNAVRDVLFGGASGAPGPSLGLTHFFLSSPQWTACGFRWQFVINRQRLASQTRLRIDWCPVDALVIFLCIKCNR